MEEVVYIEVALRNYRALQCHVYVFTNGNNTDKCLLTVCQKLCSLLICTHGSYNVNMFIITMITFN